MLLTAPLIHNGLQFLPEGTAIEVSDDGTVTAVRLLYDGTDAVSFEGILCPGFVNVHCHLELSHMKGMIPEHTGLIPFLQQVTHNRHRHTPEQMQAARKEAFEELIRNGVVATGDIVNTSQTADLRMPGGMHLHTFIECIGFLPAKAPSALQQSLALLDIFARQPASNRIHRQSITPHAPYSVSEELFRLIDRQQAQSLLSIHNQESAAENIFFRDGNGPVRELLSALGIDDRHFQPTGKNSLPVYGHWIAGQHPLILVHNTFMEKEDLDFARLHFSRLFCCLCPNANRYIEGRLPDIDLFLQAGVDLCIGTDSLASNHQLSVLAELQTLYRHMGIDWERLLRWGTLHGATALQMAESVGSLEPGKQPGILQIRNLLSDNPEVERII